MDEFDLGEWLTESTEPTDSQTPNPVGVVEKALTNNEVRILNYVEQVFWETGLCPTPEGVTEGLDLSRPVVSKAFSNETFRAQLATRGIDPTALAVNTKGSLTAVIKESKALSAKQILCANMMLNLHDKRSEREKLALIQVSSQQYHAWLRQPSFVEFLRKRGEALFSATDFQAYKSLVNNVKAGDNKSLELFFRMRGIYNPTVNININLESVLMRVIEVISVHVKDPVIINAIANGIDEIIEAEEVA